MTVPNVDPNLYNAYLGTPYNDTHRGGYGYRQCFKCGALIGSETAAEDHYRFHKNMVPREEANVMSRASWCDIGDHAYRAGEPGSQTMSVTRTDVDGMPVTEEMEACGTHSMTPKRMRALTATDFDAQDD